MHTHNEAEYTALLNGLLWCKKNHYTKDLVIFSDSELVIKQLTGKYNIKARNLRPLIQTIRNLLKEFRNYNLRWGPRHVIESRLGH